MFNTERSIISLKFLFVFSLGNILEIKGGVGAGTEYTTSFMNKNFSYFVQKFGTDLVKNLHIKNTRENKKENNFLFLYLVFWTHRDLSEAPTVPRTSVVRPGHCYYLS